MLFLVLFISILLSPSAGAVSLKEACRSFALADGTVEKKCIGHGQYFELHGDFVAACTDFSPDPDVRMRCLKSGANLETLRLCQSTGWELDNILSCMRSYPTPGVIAACKKISPDEAEQLRCVRVVREASQVAGCISFARSLENRIECLERDLPVQEAKFCARRNRDENGRMDCLHEYVARRDGIYWEKPGRALASEPAAKGKRK
jgi:hypothetical protein